jgi:hypothetical protein
VPLEVLRQMIYHPLTDTGIIQFRKDWGAAQAPVQDRATAPAGTTRG